MNRRRHAGGQLTGLRDFTQGPPGVTMALSFQAKNSLNPITVWFAINDSRRESDSIFLLGDALSCRWMRSRP